MKKAILSSIMVATLAACTSKIGSLEIEKASPVTVDTLIKRHVTTAAQVREYFGPPSRIEFTRDGREVWTYAFRRTDIKARTFIPIANLFSSEVDTSEKKVVVIFDAHKRVADYTVTENLERNKAGILEQ